MSTPVRVAAFLLGLVVAFAGSAAVGQAWGPTLPEPEPETHGTAHDDEEVVDLPGGLMRAQDGYSLDLRSDRAGPGSDVPLAFTITGPDGEPVRAYDVVHERPLHLIVVRRDLTGFQHVHPDLDATTGIWSTEIALTPGTWRIFADFRATGAEAITLGSDLLVPGEVDAGRAVAPTNTASVDGYTVTLDAHLHAAEASELTLSVSRDGRPVTDLQPYLGAFGHLVALREGDLAYLHVHPHESEQAGPDITFTAEVPSAGRYALFLDFRHGGVVRTAAFTVEVPR